MANPYLSHLLDRLQSDLEFLSGQKLLDSSDVQFIRSKLDSIPRDQPQATAQQGELENSLSALQLGQGPARAGNESKGQCKAVWNYNKSQVRTPSLSTRELSSDRLSGTVKRSRSAELEVDEETLRSSEPQ
jgi:hypothetical protein